MYGVKERTLEFEESISKMHLQFDGYIYDPLSYALDSHLEYQEMAGEGHAPTMLMGMNPGPYGMVQTGVPFGDIPTVRDFLKIRPVTGHPGKEHPARPVLGFSCKRTEVSGQRIWGLLRSLYPDRDELFSHFTIQNYCPLAFLDGGRTARNITPDRLTKHDLSLITALCDEYIKDIMMILEIHTAVGVGIFAYERLTECAPSGVRILRMMHPSPANPQANRCFAAESEALFRREGLL